MLKSYLTIAIRNLIRNKTYTVINALGLAMGIAFCLLTFLFIRHEWTYDQFHKKSDHIFRVIASTENSRTGDEHVRVMMPEKLGPLLQEDFPQITHQVRLRDGKRSKLTYSDQIFEDHILFASEKFFQMFSFPLLQGDSATALSAPNSIVLTQSIAQKYFGPKNPLGQEIVIEHSYWQNKSQTFMVRGIAQNPPINSSIQFDVLIPYSILPPQKAMSLRMVNGKMVAKEATGLMLYAGSNVTYVQLADKTQIANITNGFKTFIDTHSPNANMRFDLQLQPIKDIHFDQRAQMGLAPASNPTYSYILAGIALSVLLIACVNFINLSVARSTSRAQEIGVRKVVGALRTQLMQQFWGESFLLAGLALILGIALAEFFLPIFNGLTQTHLSLSYWSTPSIVIFLPCLFLFIGLISGIYPALILSEFDPISVLKNRLKLNTKSWTGRFLLVGQFTIAISLLIVTVLMSQQLTFLKDKDLGINESQVVQISVDAFGRNNNLRETFEQELERHPNIISITKSRLFSQNLDQGLNEEMLTLADGTEVRISTIDIDHKFVSTLGLNILAGRDFSSELVTDETQSVLVNEALMQAFQVDQPLNAHVPIKRSIMKDGFRIKPDGTVENYKPIPIRNPNIIGVVKNFHLRSLYHQVPPLVIFLNPKRSGNDFLIRIRPENIPETLAFISEQWQSISSTPLEYTFLDESFDRLYRQVERWGTIVNYSALFALFVACLGILGLTALAITRRTKEIGIRKVLGASASHIVALLSKEFMALILIANTIAWPIAYYITHRWLQDFAYRIEISIGVFILGGILTLAVALLTIGSLAFKAAQRNPVHALRYE